MNQVQDHSLQQNQKVKRRVVIGVWAIFIAEFVSLLFANARNIAQPSMVGVFPKIYLSDDPCVLLKNKPRPPWEKRISP